MANSTLHEQKGKLLDAAFTVIRSQGYAGSTVEDICSQAGVTKGSFFHHFKSKEEMTLTAIEHWNSMTGGFFARAPYHQLPDPLDRLLAYIDFRSDIIQGALPDYTCFLGTLVQETYSTHPRIREWCEKGLAAHTAGVVLDIEAAKALYCPGADWEAGSVGAFIQAVLQGSFVLAKATGNAQVAKESLVHLKNYLKSLFTEAPLQRNPHEPNRN